MIVQESNRRPAVPAYSSSPAKLRARLKGAEALLRDDPKGTLVIANELLAQAFLCGEHRLYIQIALLNFGCCFLLRDNPNCWVHLQKAEKVNEQYIKRESERLDNTIKILWRKSLLLHDANEISEAIEILQQAISICPKDHELYYRLFNDLAFNHAGRGEHVQAIDIYYQLVEWLLADSSESKKEHLDLLLTTYMRLADSYCMINDSEQARHFVAKGLGLMDFGVGKSSHRSAFYTILADLSKAEGDHPSALSHYQYALQALGPYEERSHQAELHCRISSSLIKLNRYDEVKSHLDAAYIIAQEMNEPMLSASVQMVFAKLHHHAGRTREAIEAYERARGYLNTNSPDFEIEICINISLLYEELGEYREAYDYYQKAMKVEAAYRGAAIQQQVSRKELKYRIQQKLHEQEAELKESNSWENFRLGFEKMYPQFFPVLTRSVKELTPMELKICALLHAQFSSKDIASLLSLSIHTVHTHRRFIRKKLKVAERDNLVPAIIQYST